MSDFLFNNLSLLANSIAPQATQTSQPASQELPELIICLVIAGSLVLAVWTFNAIVRPARIQLRKCPGRPSKLNPVHLIVVFFLWHGAALGVMELLLLIDLPNDKAGILGSVAGQIIGIPIALIVASICFRNGLKRGLGLSMRHWLFDTGRGIAGYLAAMPVCIGLLLLFTWLLPEEWQRKHSLLEALREMGPMYKTIIAISAVVLAPLMEEIFFRGLLQSMLRKYFHPWMTIIIASVIFASVHGQPQNIPALFALSVAMGYNYERCGRLWPAILIHMIFNGVMIAVNF